MEGKLTSDTSVAQPDFRGLFESSPGLYLVLTPNLKIVAVTDAYLRATMTTREGILGRHLFDVFPDNPSDPSATGVGNLSDSLQRVLATRETDVMALQKYDIRQPDSQGGDFEVRYWSPINSPVLDAGNAIVYIIHRVEDVTEFIRLKQQGQEQSHVTDALLELTQRVEAEVYIRGQELLSVNQQLRTSNTLLNQLYRQIEELTSQADSESAGPDPTKVLIGTSPGSLAPEEILARVGTLVAARNELEDQLRQALKMEAVGRLAGGVAHDFNNLLTVILGYSSLLREESAVSVPDCIREIENAASRAAALTKQLLAFSRKQVLQQRVLNVNEVVSSMEEMIRRLIGEDILLELHLDPEPALVKADRGQLEQVILNLAVNARDAMRFGGTLHISTRNTVVEAGDTEYEPNRPFSHVEIAVADTGAGMDPETQARIFEPFFTTKDEGTGLGLATVYGIVKQSGGMVSVNSQVGSGTTFTIMLPLTTEGTESSPSGKDRLGSGKGAGLILLVEDESALLKLISGTLKRAGYRVVEAGSGKDALSASEGVEKFDLLLTDVVMPGMTGPQLVEMLLQQGKVGTVLFMSGYAQQLIGKGTSEIKFLPKPFTPNALLNKVQEVLGVATARALPKTAP